MSKTTASVSIEDLFEIVCACHAALAQDAPYSEKHYLASILGLSMGYLPMEKRNEIETYLAEKSYLPPVTIEVAK